MYIISFTSKKCLGGFNWLLIHINLAHKHQQLQNNFCANARDTLLSGRTPSKFTRITENTTSPSRCVQLRLLRRQLAIFQTSRWRHPSWFKPEGFFSNAPKHDIRNTNHWKRIKRWETRIEFQIKFWREDDERSFGRSRPYQKITWARFLQMWPLACTYIGLHTCLSRALRAASYSDFTSARAVMRSCVE